MRKCVRPKDASPLYIFEHIRSPKPHPESPEITGIHQTHQIPPKFTSFHRFMIGGDSCCRFVFKRLPVGTKLAFRVSVQMETGIGPREEGNK
jgi:hypothetical protein